jgi:hypothetical protein
LLIGVAPDTDFAGYPAVPKAGAGRIPDIRPDVLLANCILVKYLPVINL